MRFPSRRYFCSSLAPFSSQSLTRPSMKSALLLLITGVMVQLSCSRIPATLRSKPALLTIVSIINRCLNAGAALSMHAAPLHVRQVVSV